MTKMIIIILELYINTIYYIILLNYKEFDDYKLLIMYIYLISFNIIFNLNKY